MQWKLDIVHIDRVSAWFMTGKCTTTGTPTTVYWYEALIINRNLEKDKHFKNLSHVYLLISSIDNNVIKMIATVI